MENRPNDSVNYAQGVEKALAEIAPSDDPLDASDFNIVDYINQLFPTEQSLSGIDDVITRFEQRSVRIDSDISDAIHHQMSASVDGKRSLDGAQKLIRDLFMHIKDIKERAEQSEQLVREITRDIKQLDCAKKNLTLSITTLNHLHMLVEGVDTIKSYVQKRSYGDIVLPLEAITEVMHHFENYLDIPQIKNLNDEVTEIRRQLAELIIDDFQQAFQAGHNSSITSKTLGQACLIAQNLPAHVKRDLVTWFVDLQLAEYAHLFQDSEDTAWLDKIDRRYAWLKRHLLEFEERYGSVIFPTDWQVSEKIAVEFCTRTRDALSRLLAKRKSELDCKLLLYAIQKTVAFETLLERKFDRSFDKLIGQCFLSHLDVYIDSIDRNLTELIGRFVRTGGDAHAQGAILSSCPDLFVFYKKSLIQCTQLDNGVTLVKLMCTFQKYLHEYAEKVLLSSLPKGSRDLSKLSTTPSGLIPNFSVFMKEGEAVRLSGDEVGRVCCMLMTAEYSLETTQQLSDKLKEKIDSKHMDQVDLSNELDAFHKCISTSIQVLVQDLENACEPALTTMSKIQWQHIDSVGDQSAYVTAIISHLRIFVPQIRDNLSHSRRYFTQFCIKFATSFIPKFVQTIYKCKPINTEGAEQLLLDAHMLKTVLLNLPAIASDITRPPPVSYTKVVTKSMTKAEMILKVVMTPVEPTRHFVEQYRKLLPDCAQTEFQKVLDMKNVRRQEQTCLIDVFKSWK